LLFFIIFYIFAGMSKKSIHIKPENKGKFNATKKKTGKTTEELTHSSNPVTKKRAIFAQNAAKWHHAYGGHYIPSFENVDEYGMGSWLGMAGGIASMIPGGQMIGAGLNLASGILGDNKQNQLQKDQIKQMNDQAIANNRLAMYNQESHPAYAPTFAYGGMYDDGGELKPDEIFQRREQYLNKLNRPIQKTGKYFTIKDVQNGKPGIRNGTKVDRGVLNALLSAAAREGVSMMDALSVGMRETGLGYHAASLSPAEIMQAHNAENISSIPMNYDQWRMKNNRVDKKYIGKYKTGYVIDMAEPDESKNKHLGDYDSYLKTFKYDKALEQPFTKEMRFLKENSGKKYNPGESDRMKKLQREQQVIKTNKDLYNYADSVYKANVKKYAMGGTPMWEDKDNRPVHNMFALGGDIDKLSAMKSYGYNLMASGGHMPEGTATLKEARQFKKQFPDEMAMGIITEYEHTGNRDLASRIAADHVKDYLKMTGTPGYYSKMKQVGLSDELNNMTPQDFDQNLMQNINSRKMASGGHLSSSKAKEMLRDGTAHKKPLTEKQKRYFQAIAHGMKPKALGGDLPIWGAKTPYYEEIGTIPEHRNYADGGELKGRRLVSSDPRYAKPTPHVSNPNWTPLTDAQLSLYNPSDIVSLQGSRRSTMNKGKVQHFLRNTVPIETTVPPVITPAPNGMGVDLRTQYDMITGKYTNLPNPISTSFAAGGYSAYGGGVAMKDFKGPQSYSISGGIMDSTDQTTNSPYTEYSGGGSHEQNPLGGIPVGGKARVEAGEVKFKFDDGDYIFSDRY
jgi:hypothetical protein